MAQPQVLPDQPHPAQTQSQPDIDNRQGQEIRVEDENEATAMQPGLRNHRRNRHRHHRREHNLHQAAASHPLPARTQSQPQNPQEPETQAALTESSGQHEAMAQSQPLPSDRPTQTQSLSANPQVSEVKPTTSDTSVQREAMAQSQPLPSDRPTQTQSLSANPQVSEVKPTTSDTSGQREAMAQSQPLPSDRPTQTQSNSVSSQELSVQSTPSNSADEREAMASQQPLRLHQSCSVQTQSQPDNRQEHESSLHGNQSEQPNTNSQDHEDRFRVAQMALRRLIRELPQRTRDSLILWHRDGLQLPRVNCEDRVDMSLDILMAALKSVPVIPQEATNYRALFHLCENVEHSVAQHFITEAIQHNAMATQNNAIVIQHRIAIAQHLAEEALHNAKVTQHFVTVTEHIAAAVPNNDLVTQHIMAATQHISAAIQHNDAATQRRSALRQHIAAATHNNAATMGQIPDYHSSPDNGLSKDKIQEIPTRQFSRGAERSGSDQTSCVFCICDFEDKQLLRILPCFHEFHAECVDEWLKTHRTCPVCRHDVTENRSKS